MLSGWTNGRREEFHMLLDFISNKVIEKISSYIVASFICIEIVIEGQTKVHKKRQGIGWL